MANIFQPRWDEQTSRHRRARIGDQVGCDKLGASLYEFAPGEGMVFHYHLGWEEMLVVLHGRPTLRTFDGERELGPGEVVAFPRGERGAHGYTNRTDEPVRVLVLSELTAPNVSVYPDSEEVGLFDAPHRADRRFGARFRLGDAVAGYGGGEPAIGRPTRNAPP
jgi:uncharacterized cupin superfamily protein